jgi:hypothetical protein
VAVDEDVAARRREEPGEHPKEGRLPRAVGTDDGQLSTLSQFERHVG